MIARGIVEKILDNKEILVRVPLLNKSANAPGATPTEELDPAVVCNMPNCSVSVKVGDIVFVGFENNDYSKPIILGYLFSDSGNASQLNIEADTLTVNSKVKLPADTSIGKVTSSDIYNLFQSSDNLQQQIDYLKEHSAAGDFVEKKKSGGGYYAYCSLDDNDVMRVIDSKLTANAIIARDAYGRAKCSDPDMAYDIANKWYVDSKISDIKRYHHYITLKCPSYWDGSVAFLLVNDRAEPYSDTLTDNYGHLMDDILNVESNVISASGVLRYLEDTSRAWISYGISTQNDSLFNGIIILTYYQTVVKSASDDSYIVETVQKPVFADRDTWEILDTVF